MIKNRIEKNWSRLKSWTIQQKIEAYRLYDHDIPEFPFLIDRYKDQLLVYDRTDSRDEGKNQLPHVLEALEQIFKVPQNQIIVKKRDRQKGDQQYEKLDDTKNFFLVRESQALLRVNLIDYLDTGLFLDHRPMRQKIFKESQGKKFLNLFCYTGAVSVFAALGGAQTTSVDMSKTYMAWAEENFTANGISKNEHEFIVEDCLKFLDRRQNPEFDLIFLDPPTFSNSKKMDGNFDVERDQVDLVSKTMALLKPGGVLYFSNNLKKFKMDEDLKKKFQIAEISESTIPRDFHNLKIHHCFRILHL